jgi:hypothetical protein
LLSTQTVILAFRVRSSNFGGQVARMKKGLLARLVKARQGVVARQ